jgi:predicted ATPase
MRAPNGSRSSVKVIARSLGVPDTGDHTLHESLRLATRERRLLLLDNFEQVIEAAPLASELLANASELRVLVTSREALHLRGEHERVTEPLDLPTEQDVAHLEGLANSASVASFVATAGRRRTTGLHPDSDADDRAPALDRREAGALTAAWILVVAHLIE